MFRNTSHPTPNVVFWFHEFFETVKQFNSKFGNTDSTFETVKQFNSKFGNTDSTFLQYSLYMNILLNLLKIYPYCSIWYFDTDNQYLFTIKVLTY